MRGILGVFVASLFLLFPLGCAAPGPMIQSPTAAGLKPSELVHSTDDGVDGHHEQVFHHLFALSERVRESQKPDVLPPKRTALVLSGGGSYGAYTAGVLCGWTEAGNRPEFDVVTGVSTGALIAVFAFLGPEYDPALKRSYTTIGSADIYHKKSIAVAIFSDSLNDSKPLFDQIERTITPDVVEQIAEAHRSGRRLYIGTTDLDGRRPVVWDMGAIAASDNPDRRELLCKLLLASAAIPAFFPVVEVPVVVDGKKYVERHVDGGLTQPLFFRPPSIAEEKRSVPLPEVLYGSDEYIIVAGKLYADPHPVRAQVLPIVGSSVTTFLHAQTRDTLVKLYMQTMLTGMKYHLAAIPSDFPAPLSPTDFNTVEMSKMFEEGRRQSLAGTVWRNTPPGVGGREELLQRTGTSLTVLRNPDRPSPASDPLKVDDPIWRLTDKRK